jgi:hypothetical protein
MSDFLSFCGFIWTRVYHCSLAYNFGSLRALLATQCSQSMIHYDRGFSFLSSCVGFEECQFICNWTVLAGAIVFLFSTVCSLALGPPSLLYSGNRACLVKWLGFESDYSPLSNYAWSCTSSPPHVFMAWCLLSTGTFRTVGIQAEIPIRHFLREGSVTAWAKCLVWLFFYCMFVCCTSIWVITVFHGVSHSGILVSYFLTPPEPLCRQSLLCNNCMWIICHYWC